MSPDRSSYIERRWAAGNLAARLLSDAWSLSAIAAAIDEAMAAIHHRTRAALAVRVFALGEGTFPPAPPVLTEYLLRSDYFRPPSGLSASAFLEPPAFAPIEPFAALPIPAFATPGALAAWLDLPVEQLDWLSDERRGHRRAWEPALQHYHYAVIRKRGGSSRLIEAPKPRLKSIQRRILHEILNAVPVHEAAHGFVAGRSCLTGAQIHGGETIVATFDLSQFFSSIGLPRVHGLFRCLGYPWAVARRLTGLCTTITPADLFRRIPGLDDHQQALCRMPHLPQGAPTSPALANLLAWPLDRRLSKLAAAAGANYTRYADDMAFSGDAALARGLGRLGAMIETIVREEGFDLNPAKTRFMQRSGRQQVTGVVVNDHCNVERGEFDRLKAILHNCARTGPSGQNRADVPDFRRHLDGRVAWVEQVNPERGAKLRGLFDRIDWRDRVSETG